MVKLWERAGYIGSGRVGHIDMERVGSWTACQEMFDEETVSGNIA